MRTLHFLTRLLVGVLFIFSGLVKANDPLGLSYKMQEFFEVFGCSFFNQYSLLIAIVMIAFEIIAGVAVVLGWQMKLFSWLLLLLIVFFTFLTSYALLSGNIKTCGCFGDCIPLTPLQSFTKDVILLILILFIFLNKKNIPHLFSTVLSKMILLLTVIFSFGLQWYVLKYLPLVDCLPYKVGSHIASSMKVPPGAIPDSTVITFQYKKQGKLVTFEADHFPEDFDDSLYQFVKRYDKLVRKGNAEPAIKDFSLTTIYGNDSTQALLAYEGYSLWLLVPDTINLQTAKAWLPELRTARSELLPKKNIHFFVITNQLAAANRVLNEDKTITAATILNCDGVAIKTAARSNPTLYLIKTGTIVNKWASAKFSNAYTALTKL
jgi:uncharacterized membrane protein YphA (DoxX/SURF4 family)